jgi:hypothetical protein
MIFIMSGKPVNNPINQGLNNLTNVSKLITLTNVSLFNLTSVSLTLVSLTHVRM